MENEKENCFFYCIPWSWQKVSFTCNTEDVEQVTHYFLYNREGRVSSRVAVVVVVVSAIASLRFEDEDENEDQVQLLLIVRMLKSVTVMAWQCCCNQLRRPGLVEDEKVLRFRCGEKRELRPRPRPRPRPRLRLRLRLRRESKAL